MDEIQVLIPVAVKSKLTEALKTTLLNQINQNIKSVENDMTQLEFEANAKLAEQAKINMQAVAPLRAQYDAQKAQMIQEKFFQLSEHGRPFRLRKATQITPHAMRGNNSADSNPFAGIHIIHGKR